MPIEQPVSLVPIPSNVNVEAFMRDVQNAFRQIDRVMTQALAINNGQGLAFVNPYIPVGAPADGDIPQWDASRSPKAYVPTSVNNIIGFGFFSVGTESLLPTAGSAPTIPSLGYAQDTGVYYVYNLIDVAWQKIGLVFP